MPNTVGNYGVTTFTSPSNGDALDATVVKSNDNTLRTAHVGHDADPGIHLQSSLLADRPAAGTAGRKWMTTDTGAIRVWHDNGSSWEEVIYISPNTSATLAALLLTGNLTVNGNTTLGDASSDTVSVVAQLISDLVPSTTNTRDLGSTSNRWRDIYLAGGVTAAGSLAISGTTTTGGLSVTGTTASFRSVTYTMPAAQGAASTILTNDGSGGLTWASSATPSVTGSDIYLRATFR